MMHSCQHHRLTRTTGSCCYRAFWFLWSHCLSVWVHHDFNWSQYKSCLCFRVTNVSTLT